MEPSLGLVLHGGGGGEQTAKEAELELGLGLSLGGGGGGGGAAEKSKGCAWGHEYGRILTAKDFPNGFSSAGTKRERTASEGSASAAVSNQVVGWPPIRAYRMNTLFNQSKTSNVEDHDKRVGGNENNDNSNKKINHGNESVHIDSAIKKEMIRGHLGFVKVNMDGLPIGRKVDLNAHKSYDTLANTLEDMFFNPSIRKGKESPKLLDGSSEFVLTYEDREGDWMLVGDVPWGMFFSTVKRLRIMRKSEANGLAPKFEEKNEKQKSKII